MISEDSKILTFSNCSINDLSQSVYFLYGTFYRRLDNLNVKIIINITIQFLLISSELPRRLPVYYLKLNHQTFVEDIV